MKSSTSIYNLNADKGLRIHQKLFFIFNNLVNNLFPYTNVDDNLRIEKFVPEKLKQVWALTDIKSSPSRKLSDLFLLNLPWEKIKLELGMINILDIGCGSGDLGSKLQVYSCDNINNYTGVDIQKSENWYKLAEKHGNFQFYQLDFSKISEHILNENNFIITQSAIEHFNQDLVFFEQIRKHLQNSSKNFIQIHLFPSSACIWLYPFHGVRQYTPRTVSKITMLLNDSSYSVLFKLGGKWCNSLHWQFITKPLYIQRTSDFRYTKTQEYDRLLFQAVEKDVNTKQSQKSPNFYALVIHSNWREKIV